MLFVNFFSARAECDVPIRATLFVSDMCVHMTATKPANSLANLAVITSLYPPRFRSQATHCILIRVSVSCYYFGIVKDSSVQQRLHEVRLRFFFAQLVHTLLSVVNPRNQSLSEKPHELPISFDCSLLLAAFLKFFNDFTYWLV